MPQAAQVKGGNAQGGHWRQEACRQLSYVSRLTSSVNSSISCPASGAGHVRHHPQPKDRSAAIASAGKAADADKEAACVATSGPSQGRKRPRRASTAKLCRTATICTCGAQKQEAYPIFFCIAAAWAPGDPQFKRRCEGDRRRWVDGLAGDPEDVSPPADRFILLASRP